LFAATNLRISARTSLLLIAIGSEYNHYD
jgi:hypothetical protein